MVGSTRAMRVVSVTVPSCIGYVEIDAEQHALAADVEPIDGANAREVGLVPAVQVGGAGNGRDINVVHINLLITTAVSLMRLEKPHSLSYQDTTRQKVPSTTWVLFEIEDRA